MPQFKRKIGNIRCLEPCSGPNLALFETSWMSETAVLVILQIGCFKQITEIFGFLGSKYQIITQ